MHIFISLALLLVALPAYAAVPIDGLQAHWKFDETSGTSAADSSGNNNTAMLMDGPIWIAGKLGGAVSLDGVGDYINTELKDSYENITLSMWVKRLTCTDNAFPKLIYKGNAFEFDLSLSCTNKTLKFTHLNSGGQWTLPNGSVPSEEWKHIALVQDNSVSPVSVKIYVNGEDKTIVMYAPTASFASDGGTYILGSQNGISGFANAIIDDVRIYNRALSDAEVLELYNYDGTTPAPTPTGVPEPSPTPSPSATPAPTATPEPTVTAPSTASSIETQKITLMTQLIELLKQLIALLQQKAAGN